MKEGINYFLKSDKTRFYFLLTLFLVCIGVFAALAHEVVGENEDWFDTSVFSFLEVYSTPAVINFLMRSPSSVP